MNWLHSSLTDETGSYDVAYVSLAGITFLILGSIVYVCCMTLVDWWVCNPVIEDGKLLIACGRFDADAIGNAVGKICAAYAAALAALAGYMAATRRPDRSAPAAPPAVVTTTLTTTETASPPQVAASKLRPIRLKGR